MCTIIPEQFIPRRSPMKMANAMGDLQNGDVSAGKCVVFDASYFKCCAPPLGPRRPRIKAVGASSRFHRRLAFFWVLTAAVLGLGWGQTWEDIRSGAGKIQSVQTDFVQEKHMKILAAPLISRGKFWFRMPDALRWEYTEPIGNVLLLYNGRSRRYIQNDAGWIEEDTAGLQAMQVVLMEITNWLNGDFDANPDFTAALAPERKIILTPKSQGLGRIIEKIVLDLSLTPGIIEAVTIHEGPDSHTRLTFQAPVLNQPIDDAVFQTVE